MTDQGKTILTDSAGREYTVYHEPVSDMDRDTLDTHGAVLVVGKLVNGQFQVMEIHASNGPVRSYFATWHGGQHGAKEAGATRMAIIHPDHPEELQKVADQLRAVLPPWECTNESP